MRSYLYKYLLILLFITASSTAYAEGIPVMRISLENRNTHIQVLAVQRFVDEVISRASGKIDIQLFTEAKLFRDKDVLNAMKMGNVEMAIPGTWQFSRHVPEVGATLLPIFYGLSAEESRILLDGELGKAINTSVMEKLGVHIPGSWLDLGYGHIFAFNAPIVSPDDLNGKRIRVAGGIGNVRRNELLGATALDIAWPDLPAVLKRRQIDGVLTSYATVYTANLHKAGLVSVLEDRQYFPRYIPLIRARFWKNLSPELQVIISQAWENMVIWEKIEAAKQQDEAREALRKEGIRIIHLLPEELTATRNRLMAHQAEIARASNIPDDFIALLNKLSGVY